MMSFEQSKDNFINYLKIEKDASPYTIKLYEIDVAHFWLVVQAESINEFKDVDHVVVRVCLTPLYDKDLRRRSGERVLSCLRRFYSYLGGERLVNLSRFLHVNFPKQGTLIPGFF